MGHRLWLPALLLLLLVACAGEPPPRPTAGPGDADRGAAIFQAPVLGDGAPSCRNCHALVPDDVLVGPSLYGVADRAAATVPGLTAATYLEQAIVAPDAHLVEGYAAGAMHDQYATDLTPQEIADLVAFLLTLEEAPAGSETHDDA